MEANTGNTLTGGDKPIVDLWRGPGRNFSDVFSYGIDAPAYVAAGSHQRSEIWSQHGETCEAWISPSLAYRGGAN